MFCFLVAASKVLKWIRNQRTEYCKLVDSVSGQATKRYTARMKDIVRRWSFLQGYRVQQENVTSQDVSSPEAGDATFYCVSTESYSVLTQYHHVYRLQV